MNQNDVRLVFDFAPREGEAPSRLVLTNPVEILTAHSPAEVPPLLRTAEAAAQRGLYAAGFVTYEAAPAFDPAFRVRPAVPGLPLAWFAVFAPPAPFGGALPVGGNVPLHRVSFADNGGAASVISEATKSSGTLVPANSAPPKGAGGEKQWKTDISPEQWDDGITAIRGAIARGETYQVNYTRRLRGSCEDGWGLYERLRAGQRGAGYAAFLDMGRFQVVSVSPELFFETAGRELRTRPMKGTARRGRWVEEDAAVAVELAGSAKERAENVMIVDLLRNDVGRVAEIGSVRVSSLFAIERYPTVFQMTSTVKGRLKEEVGLAGVFGALFPCGSVTGAPKVSTMEHIAALETAPRGVYCGAIGLMRPGGDAVFSVAIRTLVIDTQTGGAEYGVGGGITWDSVAEAEWRETEDKAAVLTHSEAVPGEFDLLETLRLEAGVYFLRERHLVRLGASAAYFGYRCERTIIEQALDDFAARHEAGFWRVRLRVTREGLPCIEGANLDAPPLRLDFAVDVDTIPLVVSLAEMPVSRRDVFLCHKTTHRAVYEARRNRMLPGDFDVLMWNEEEEVTEFTIGNIVAEIAGTLWTPPRDCGLLNGTLRDELLDQGALKERTLSIADIRQANHLWLVNSVRGIVPVELRQNV